MDRQQEELIRLDFARQANDALRAVEMKLGKGLPAALMASGLRGDAKRHPGYCRAVQKDGTRCRTRGRYRGWCGTHWAGVAKEADEEQRRVWALTDELDRLMGWPPEEEPPPPKARAAKTRKKTPAARQRDEARSARAAQRRADADAARAARREERDARRAVDRTPVPGQCVAQTKGGRRCRLMAVPGGDRCDVHREG